MTFEIAFVFAVVVAATVLFATDRHRIDQADPATLTVAAMLVLSLGLVGGPLNLLLLIVVTLLIPMFWHHVNAADPPRAAESPPPRPLPRLRRSRRSSGPPVTCPASRP